MLTTSFNGRNPTLCPNGRNSTIVFHGPISKSQLPGRTLTSQNHDRTPTLWQRTLFFMLQWQRLNCLPAWSTVYSQLSPFSKSPNSQHHRFRALRHPRSSFISYLGFIMTIVIVISSARERKLYLMSVHLN